MWSTSLVSGQLARLGQLVGRCVSPLPISLPQQSTPLQPTPPPSTAMSQQHVPPDINSEAFSNASPRTRLEVFLHDGRCCWLCHGTSQSSLIIAHQISASQTQWGYPSLVPGSVPTVYLPIIANKFISFQEMGVIPPPLTHLQRGSKGFRTLALLGQNRPTFDHNHSVKRKVIELKLSQLIPSTKRYHILEN